MKRVILIALSFLLMYGCNTFEEKETKMAATFTIAVPGQQVQLSGNPIIINATTTTTGKTSHHLLCRVTCTDGAIPGGPWIDSIAPKNGAATFDISGLVDTDFNYAFSTIIDPDNKFNENNALAANIEIEIGESYLENNAIIEEWNTDDAYPMTVLKGKLTRHEFNMLSANSRSFYTEWIYGHKWLTKLNASHSYSSPEVKVSSVSDEVKAWFVVNTLRSITVQSNPYFSDGTYETYIDETPHDCDFGYVYELDLQKYVVNTAGKKVEKYTVSIVGTKRTYTVIVDNIYYETHNTLYFANTLGVVEVLHCYGECMHESNIKNETVVSDTYNFSPLAHTVKVSENSNDIKYTINTGFKSLSERKWLVDFFKSPKIWLKETNPLLPDLLNVNLVPVTIVPGSYTINDTSDDLLSIEFQIQIAHLY